MVLESIEYLRWSEQLQILIHNTCKSVISRYVLCHNYCNYFCSLYIKCEVNKYLCPIFSVKAHFKKNSRGGSVKTVKDTQKYAYPESGKVVWFLWTYFRSLTLQSLCAGNLTFILTVNDASLAKYWIIWFIFISMWWLRTWFYRQCHLKILPSLLRIDMN